MKGFLRSIRWLIVTFATLSVLNFIQSWVYGSYGTIGTDFLTEGFLVTLGWLAAGAIALYFELKSTKNKDNDIRWVIVILATLDVLRSVLNFFIAWGSGFYPTPEQLPIDFLVAFCSLAVGAIALYFVLKGTKKKGNNKK